MNERFRGFETASERRFPAKTKVGFGESVAYHWVAVSRRYAFEPVVHYSNPPAATRGLQRKKFISKLGLQPSQNKRN